uniref:Uncharacterized protein n=1 Tax=Arundo donax TaxID=35708 RepID=A0A0A8YPJ0_ARUDO
MTIGEKYEALPFILLAIALLTLDISQISLASATSARPLCSQLAHHFLILYSIGAHIA